MCSLLRMCCMNYRTANSNEILAITGWGVDNIRLAKKAMILAGQSCSVYDLSPVNYNFQVQAMSSEKLPFLLPAVFTIGPRIDDHDSLIKFVTLIAKHDKNSNHVNDLVQGVIEGETRVLAASMTMEEIFKGTKEFKKEVFDKVQLELNQFGPLIYNANVKQLVDVAGHEYFSYLGQKTQMEAANQAKVDVAEAKMKGETVSKQREGQTVQYAAKIDAETKIFSTRQQGEGKKEEIRVQTEVKLFENEKAAEIARANAELAKKQAGWAKEAQLAEVESQKAVAKRESELQTEVEVKNALQMTEKQKAEKLSTATVDYETQVKKADGELYQKQKAAEALLYAKEKEGQGRRAIADADLYKNQKEAEGLKVLAEAQSEQVHLLLQSLGGNYSALRDYMMINGGLYQDIAQINAQAVHGLQPKISIWSDGSRSGDSGDGAMKEMADVYRMLPPLFQAVHDQTGMQPPAWIGKLSTLNLNETN